MLVAEELIVGVVTALVVVLCVLVHYEGLRLLSDKLPTPKHYHRRRMISLILFVLLLHVIEIWLFGGAYIVLLKFDDFGELIGGSGQLLVETIYYSATVYTTVGFGDIHPVGPIRTMTGMQAVTGLTLITWSASYSFVEMNKTWVQKEA